MYDISEKANYGYSTIFYIFILGFELANSILVHGNSSWGRILSSKDLSWLCLKLYLVLNKSTCGIEFSYQFLTDTFLRGSFGGHLQP